MSDFQPGEVVDITIKGARVLTFDDHGVLVFRYANDDEGAAGRVVFLGAEGVTAERVAPSEWPPQAGDLWRRDDTKDLYFAADVHDIEETEKPEIVMVCAYENYRQDPEEFRRQCAGRVTLVHRETEQDEAETAEDDTPVAYPVPGSEIPGQPGYVVGTCGHRVAGSEWRAGFRTCERCPHKVGEQA